MAEPTPASGQATTAEPSGTTAAAPQSSGGGQSANPGQTTSNGPDSGHTESFFDPKDLEGKPELQAAYKQMQSKWTKELQKFKQSKSKVDAYDAFIKDPAGTMQQLAQQYGYQLVQRGQDAKPDDFKPQTWDDVLTQAEKRAHQKIMKELDPMLGEIRNMKQQNVEQYLDNHFSDWRTYEDDMLETLQAHPSLANDPDKLYRLSVPNEVWEARATKRAMEKLRASSENGQVSGANTTRTPTTDDGPPKGGSINDHVAYAKEQLRRKGIVPGL